MQTAKRRKRERERENTSTNKPHDSEFVEVWSFDAIRRAFKLCPVMSQTSQKHCTGLHTTATKKHTNTQTHKHTNTQTPNTQTHKHTNTQTHKHWGQTIGINCGEKRSEMKEKQRRSSKTKCHTFCFAIPQQPQITKKSDQPAKPPNPCRIMVLVCWSLLVLFSTAVHRLRNELNWWCGCCSGLWLHAGV